MSDQDYGYRGGIKVENDRWSEEVRYSNDTGIGYLVVLGFFVCIWAFMFPSCAKDTWKSIQEDGQHESGSVTASELNK